jgi:hypothetical protein
MPKDFETGLTEKQRQILLSARKCIEFVRLGFANGERQHVQEMWRKDPHTIINKMLDAAAVIKYVNHVSQSNETLDFYLIEYLIHAVIVDEVAANRDFVRDLIRQYIENRNLKPEMEMIEKVFYLALNISLRVNLQKMIDIYCNIVYYLNLDKEHDHCILSNLLSQSLLYTRRYTHMHTDSTRSGWIAVRKFDHDNNGFEQTDPIMVFYDQISGLSAESGGSQFESGGVR